MRVLLLQTGPDGEEHTTRTVTNEGAQPKGAESSSPEACTTQKTAKNATEFTLHSTYTSSSSDDASTSSTWKKQKYVTVTLEKQFPPCLVGGARTQAGPRRKQEEELNISLASKLFFTL